MPPQEPPELGSWVTSERPLPRLLVRPLREFLDTEVAGGVILMVTTVIAIAWANSPLRASYGSLWSTDLSLRLGGYVLAQSLRDWINNGLMVLFFFVVGLELKREIAFGALSDARRALLPAIAAVGGMTLPALIYVATTTGTGAARGWGIPMATDIAFALGVLSLLGPRVPPSLKVFLLSLAVVDDVGTILVIALFYTGSIQWLQLGIALALLGAIVALKRLEVWWTPLYVVAGAGVWVATLASGVHATVAGIALGLLTPVRPRVAATEDHEPTGRGGLRPSRATASRARATKLRALATVSVTEQLEHLLHPWTSYIVIPLFALANAGISLEPAALSRAARSPVALGIIVARVMGKMVGITLFTWLGVRLGVAALPRELPPGALPGVAAVAGVGFTVPLFVSALAFAGPTLQTEVKVGILAATVVSGLVGAVILHLSLGSAPTIRRHNCGASPSGSSDG